MPVDAFSYNIKAGVNGSSIGYDGQLVNEDLSYTVNAINWLTSDLFINGNKTVAIEGLPDNWTFTIEIDTITAENLAMNAPGMHDFDLRHNEPTLNRNTYDEEFHNIRCLLKGKPLGLVPEINATLAENNKSTMEFTGFALYLYRNNVPIVELDQVNKVFRINGVDYWQKVRQGLQTKN